MTEGGGSQQFQDEAFEAEVAAVAASAQETNPGGVQIEGIPNEAPEDGVEQGAPGADGTVQTPEVGAPAAEPGEPLDKAATITSLQEKNLVNADQARLLQATSEAKAQIISQLIEEGHWSGDDIQFLLELSEEDLKAEVEEKHREELLKNAAVDQMIRDGVFNEADKEGLLALKLDDLQEWLANWNDNPEVARHLAEIQRQKDELPALYKTDEEGNLQLKGEGIIDQDYLREQASREVARQELAFLGTGGKLDKAIGNILLPDVIKDVDKEFEDKLAAEAANAYKQHAAMTPQDVVHTIFIDENNKLLSEQAFLKAYIQDRKDPIKHPELQEEISARVQQELQRRVSELRGKSGGGASEVEDSLPDESDPNQADAVKELKITMLERMISFGMFAKDQVITAGSEAFDNLLSNTDLMTIFRAFIHGGAAFDAGRGGTLGYEDGKMVRYVEEAELFAKFKKPQELGQALALAISRNKEMQAMKFTVSDELLQQAAEGDPAAVRQVMQEVVEHLHGGSNTDERWKALRQGLAEGLYPGANARLDDDIQKMFMDDKGAEALRLLDLMMPKEGAGSSSKDDKSQQPANVIPITSADGSSSQDAAAPATTPESKAA